METCTLHTHENDNDFLFDNFSPLDHLNAFAFENEWEKTERKMKYRIETRKKYKKKKRNIYIQSEAKKEHMQIHKDQIVRSEIGWWKKISIISIFGTPKKALKYGQTVKMNKCKMLKWKHRKGARYVHEGKNVPQ